MQGNDSDERQPVVTRELPKLSRDLIAQGYELASDHPRPLRRRERGGRPNFRGIISKFWECPFMDSGDEEYWPLRKIGGGL